LYWVHSDAHSTVLLNTPDKHLPFCNSPGTQFGLSTIYALLLVLTQNSPSTPDCIYEDELGIGAKVWTMGEAVGLEVGENVGDCVGDLVGGLVGLETGEEMDPPFGPSSILNTSNNAKIPDRKKAYSVVYIINLNIGYLLLLS